MNIQDIEARLAEIRGEIETRGAELTAEQLTALETEVAELKAKKAELQAAAEQRSALLGAIADGQVQPTSTRNFEPPGAQPSPAAGSVEQRSVPDEDPFGTIEYRKAFMNHVLRGDDIPAEYRADAVTKTADIGVMVPTTVLNKIIEKLETAGKIYNLVTRTAYKGGLQIPTSSVKPVATWVAEGEGSEKQKIPTSHMTFAYNKLRCAVAVSLEVDTMAMSAFEASLTNNVVEAMLRAIDKAILFGSGSGQPKGILTETPIADQVIESPEPSYQDLLDAEASLPEEYENGAVWCMSKRTFMKYFGLLDDNGQPIGRVNYGIGGKPERMLLGRTVVTSPDVTSYAPGLEDDTVFAFLFNFNDYILNTNYAMGIKRYEDNDTDDQVTKAIMLVDGKVVDKNSLVTIKMSTAP